MCSGVFGRLDCSNDDMMQGMLCVPYPLRCRDVTFLIVQVADMDNANIELEDANTQLEASTNAAEQRCAALEQEIQKLHTAQANLKVGGKKKFSLPGPSYRASICSLQAFSLLDPRIHRVLNRWSLHALYRSPSYAPFTATYWRLVSHFSTCIILLLSSRKSAR